MLYMSNSVNFLTGDDPDSIKFGPKCTDPIGRMRVSAFTHRMLCGTALAELLVESASFFACF